MPFKSGTPHKHPDGKIFSWLALYAGLSVSMVATVLPIFAKDILKTEELVSVFYAGMAVIMLLTAILSTVIFTRIERSKLTKLIIIIGAISTLFFIFVNRMNELAVTEGMRTIFKLMVFMSLSLYVRDFAKEESLGEEEGVYFKFDNIGHFIGPLIGGILAAKLGYEIVFVIASVILLWAFAYFYHLHVIIKHPAFHKVKQVTSFQFFGNFKKFFSDLDRSKAFFVRLLLVLFAAFKWLYVPLYVAFSGYLENVSGLILSIGIIPFILLEVAVGKYADKSGIRIPIAAGFLIIALSFLIVFINPIPVLNFLILILVNIGAAFIEPLQEYYLFKHMSKKEEDGLFGVYSTATPLGNFLTPGIGAVILLFLPFKFLFLIFGLIFLVPAAYFYFRLSR